MEYRKMVVAAWAATVKNWGKELKVGLVFAAASYLALPAYAIFQGQKAAWDEAAPIALGVAAFMLVFIGSFLISLYLAP